MKSPICLVLVLLITSCVSAQAQRSRQVNVPAAGRTITVITEPSAIVWIDGIRRGTTDATGRLSELKIGSGAHTLRVRANGFKEASQPVTQSEIRVRLLRTTDEAELLFQRAENTRETARDDAARQDAADLYRQALKIRDALPA